MKFRLIILLLCLSADGQARECVVLLHGLARTAASMHHMADRLQREGFEVANVDYPSREHSIDVLADLAVSEGLAQCEDYAASKIHFVTHSLGGILVRVYLKNNKRDDIGRVVMLGPPNQGSEVVDNLKNAPGFEFLNGPAGMQLGTGLTDIPRTLGPVNFELGIIAGTQSINLILSTFLPNPDDGKVSVEATKVAGMSDFIALETTHPLMMKNDAVINQTVFFLKHGHFEKPAP